jgi:hypothetical protein
LQRSFSLVVSKKAKTKVKLKNKNNFFGEGSLSVDIPLTLTHDLAHLEIYNVEKPKIRRKLVRKYI